MQQLPMTFNLQSEIAKANAEQLDRLNVWDSQALTIPAFLIRQYLDMPYSGSIGGEKEIDVPDLTRKA